MFSKQIFLALDQEPEMADMGAVFVRWSTPGILFYAWSTAYQRFCTNQREVTYTMWSNIGATAVHVGLAYWFTYGLDMGMLGLGLATSI